MKRFCIINLWFLDDEGGDVEVLDRDYSPTKFYLDRRDAELEAIRLAQKHPGGDFYVFESTYYAQKKNCFKNGRPERVVFIEPVEG